MKTRALLLLLASVMPSLAINPALEHAPATHWGTTIDPAKDCKVRNVDGRLTISVPGTEKPHDLSPELDSCTAPRVVQPVKGDFTIEVIVHGEFEPGEESSQEGRTGYTGAGLVVFADEKNFVRLERATLNRRGGEPAPYTNFEIRVDGKNERFGNTGDFKTEAGKPTWLRLERKGNLLLGSMSQDGKNWTKGEPKELRAEAWKKNDIVAGIAAISTSSQTFSPSFSQLTIRDRDSLIAEDSEPVAPAQNPGRLAK
jgi:regulation of enolase protein 1 (concanavalin A-like superfamily)